MATLLSIARHWVKFGNKKKAEQHIAEMQEMAKTLRVEHKGLTERNLARLWQFDDPNNVEALLNLPQRLFARAEAMRHGQRAAVLVQTAVAIAILLFAPMRMRNLSMIDIEQHLVRPGRKRDVLLIVFERSEVKNRQWLDYPVPDDAILWLERYLAEYRPLLCVARQHCTLPEPRWWLQEPRRPRPTHQPGGVRAHRPAGEPTPLPSHRGQASA